MNDNSMTLDIAEPQVLVHFDHDPNNLTEHHRILLNKLGPGRWLGLTPDHELVVLDLNIQCHIVLDRRSRFPDHIHDGISACDPLSHNELEGFKRRAKIMNLVLGDADMQDVEATVWVYSDPSSQKLGETVPQNSLDQAVVLGDRGLLEVDGVIEAIREIYQSEVATIKDSAKGSVGDLRTTGLHKEARNDGSSVLQMPCRWLMLVRESKFEDSGWSL